MPGWALRPLASADAGWIARACTDAEIQRWTEVPRPYTRAHAEAFVAGDHGECAVWAIAPTDATGDAAPGPALEGVGVIGVHDIDTATGDARLGYWVAPWARGRGAATAALGLVCASLTTMPGARRAVAQIAEANAASRATAHAAGFVLIGPADDTCPDGAARVTALLYARVISVGR